MSPGVRGSVVGRNALLNLGGLVTPLIVAFITLPILIDALGTERFGVLAIAWMLLAYLAELGFGSTTTRYAAEAIGAGRLGDVGAIAWTTAALQAGVGIVEGVALALATPWLTEGVLNVPDELVTEAQQCLYLLALALPVLGLGKSYRGLVEAAQRFDLAMAVHIPATAAGYIMATVAAVGGSPLPVVFGLIVGARLATLPAFLLLLRRALPTATLRPRWHREGVGELVGFAGWVAITTVVSPLLVYLDRFMVGALLSMTAVAYYAAPYEVVARLALVPAAIVGALFPAFSQLSGVGDREHAARLAARAVNMVLVILAPILIVVVGGAHDGLTAWLGPEYARESGLALQILAVGVLFNAAAHVPFGLLQSMGRPDVPARLHLIELPIQVVLAWFLVSRWGIPGAALAWTLRLTLDAALLFVSAWRLGYLDAPAFRDTRLAATLTVSAAGAAAVIASAAVVDGALARAVVLAVLAACVAGLLWRAGVAPAERGRVLALLTAGRHG